MSSVWTCEFCGWEGHDPREVPVTYAMIVSDRFSGLGDVQHVCPECGAHLDEAPPLMP